MSEIVQADLDRLCLEYGRTVLRAVVAERVEAERAAELQELRSQLAKMADRLYRPPDTDGEG